MKHLWTHHASVVWEADSDVLGLFAEHVDDVAWARAVAVDCQRRVTAAGLQAAVRRADAALGAATAAVQLCLRRYQVLRQLFVQ